MHNIHRICRFLSEALVASRLVPLDKGEVPLDPLEWENLYVESLANV